MRFYIWEHHGYDLDFEPYRKQEIDLPAVRCEHCGYTFYGAPSASDIPLDVPRALRKQLASLQTETPDALSPEIISMEAFRELSQQVRQIYNLPPTYPVMPSAYLGARFVRGAANPAWHAYGPDRYTGSLYVSRVFAERLRERAIRGVHLFPVYTPSGEQSSVLLAVVTGDGGIPKIDRGELVVCSACGRWEVRERTRVRYQVDETQWDGSDFFRFRYSLLVVSERVVEVVNEFGSSLFPYTRWEPLDTVERASSDMPVDFGPYSFLQISGGGQAREEGT